ncbi:unnamed protein product [marine sediment metagenome]|uniref:Uncharacterized protein n=1 Tax=marine sediment metagenome TaxID=412755 RepID=X1QYG6_9ZZZZ
MVETAEQAEGEAKEEMVAAVTELTDYLQRRDSPFLKELDKGNTEAPAEVEPAENKLDEEEKSVQ